MKDLGISTAYGYAVSRGYTGTEEEFAELMASYAHVAEDARASAETASNAKDEAVSAKNTAVTHAQTASNKASEAANSAQYASTSANTASTKASEASASASNAQASASTASTKASEAASSATSANSAKTDAVNAKNAAQTARTASETARTAAQEAQESAERAAQEAHDVIDHKADIDGYYEEMTVGDAEQLVSSQFVSDSVPYLYRTTGGSADVGNREYMESIVGGTVAWNQLAHKVTGQSDSQTKYGITLTRLTNAENGFTITGESTRTTEDPNFYGMLAVVNMRAGHKYLTMSTSKVFVLYGYGNVSTKTTIGGTVTACQNNGGEQLTIRPYNEAAVAAGATFNETFYVHFIDLTQMFGSTIADYIYSLEQSSVGAGVAWFKKLFPKPYYKYDAGTLKHVEGLTSHDMTGFNQWDEEWELGGISNQTGGKYGANDRIRSKNFIAILPNTVYYVKSPQVLGTIAFYDIDENFVSAVSNFSGNATVTTPTGAHLMKFCTAVYGSTYNHDICINLSHSGYRDGEYEPYQKHSYPLDSSLVLRGIPKLDAQNNLYYDGDIYNHDGTVERKYGIVDLGTLNWTYNTSTNQERFAAALPSDPMPYRGDNSNDPLPNIICDKYTASQFYYLLRHLNDKIVTVRGAGIQIYDSSYTNAASFKAAMSGVYFVYELATPTTEEAEPFQEVQICDDFGTEEFVSTSIVPVGHNTEYPANLRDKLQHLPNLADADGYYMIKQTNKQMSLEHFRIPKAPEEDGDWVLHATVSGGTPTYNWVKEETA